MLILFSCNVFLQSVCVCSTILFFNFSVFYSPFHTHTAGANISGDLKNPSYSIPQGTLLACGITMLIYAILCENNTHIHIMILVL